MKKAIVRLAMAAAIVGTIVGVRRAKRMRQKMKEHCGQMAGHCEEMMTGRNGSHEARSEHEAKSRSEKQPAVAPTA